MLYKRRLYAVKSIYELSNNIEIPIKKACDKSNLSQAFLLTIKCYLMSYVKLRE